MNPHTAAPTVSTSIVPRRSGAALTALLACLLLAPTARADEQPSRWSFSLRASAGGEMFGGTRFPDQDGMFFQEPRERLFSTGTFDHYRQSSTQSFDWSGDLQMLGGSVEYRWLPWLSFEVQAFSMRGLEFDRPATIELGYYQPDQTLYYQDYHPSTDSYELHPMCADPAQCEYYGLEYHSFSYDGQGEVAGFMGMAAAKLYAPEVWVLKPYLSLGVGMMQMSAKERGAVIESEGSRGYSFSEEFSVIIPVVQEGSNPGCDPCRTTRGTYSFDTTARAPVFQLGVGTLIELTDRLGLELNGSYQMPRGELKDLRSYNLGAQIRMSF